MEGRRWGLVLLRQVGEPVLKFFEVQTPVVSIPVSTRMDSHTSTLALSSLQIGEDQSILNQTLWVSVPLFSPPLISLGGPPLLVPSPLSPVTSPFSPSWHRCPSCSSLSLCRVPRLGWAVPWGRCPDPGVVGCPLDPVPKASPAYLLYGSDRGQEPRLDRPYTVRSGTDTVMRVYVTPQEEGFVFKGFDAG